MPEMGNTAEKRTQPRYALNLTGSAEVLYRRAPASDTPAAGPGATGRFKVETVNISAGGFMLSFDTELTAGDILMLYFDNPETRTDMEVEAQIQWMRKNAASIMGRFVAGVSVRRPDDKGIEELVAYASRQNPVVL